MELMGVMDAEVFEVVLLVDAFKVHFGGGIEVPKGSVQIEENMLIGFHFWSIWRCHSKRATAEA